MSIRLLSSLLIIEGWLGAITQGAALVPSNSGLVKRRNPADCGYWTMHCGGNTNKEDPRGAFMACNNACYYIQCMEGKMLTEQKTDDNSITVAKSDWSWKYAGKGADNREESGCDIGSGQSGITTVCNTMPFSQQFNDIQDQTGAKAHTQPLNIPLPNDPNDYRSCDEFPMNQMKLWKFNDKTGPGYADSKSKIRASLRCMPNKQNGNGGNQLAQLVRAGVTGDDAKAYPQPYRNMNNCPDKEEVIEGDQFKMMFSEISKEKTPYCQIPANEAERQKICKDNNDGLQYYMTSRSTDKGTASMPYTPDSNNRYAVHEGTNPTTPKELQQCQVEVERDVNTSQRSDKKMYVKITVQRSTKTGGTKGYKQVDSFDQEEQCATKENEYTVSKDTNMAENLVITFDKPPAGKDAINQKIEFAYGPEFKWDSDTTGKSKAMSSLTGGTDDFSYCYGSSKRARTPEDVQQDPLSKGNVKKEAITCFFPCYDP